MIELLASPWPFVAAAAGAGLVLGMVVGRWTAVPLAALLAILVSAGVYVAFELLVGRDEGYFLVIWGALPGADSEPVTGLSAAALLVGLTAAYLGVPAMAGALVGAVLRRRPRRERREPA